MAGASLSRGRLPRLPAALAIGLVVAAGVSGLRSLGAFERLDGWVYDALLRQRAEARDPPPPVTLVRILEEQIQRYGHPLPDATLARAVRRIAGHGPRAIGVDLYRDLPVGEPAGRAALADLARSIPGLVFIEKLPEPDAPGVAAPDFVPGPDALGFNDLVTDGDGVLRRGLLMLWDADDQPSFALGLQLALHHLHAEGLSLEADPRRPEWVRLGPATIPPLEPNDGGYVGVDAGGYQVLLDFAAGRDGFASYTLDDALDGVVPPEALRDRIVIVGTTSPSVKDAFLTPLAGGTIHGIEVHAHLADQLVRWAHGRAAPLRFWSEAGETAWIFAWSLLAAGLAAAARGPGTLAAGLAGVVVALGGSSAALFAAGVWVPAAPPLAAALGSGGIVLGDVVRRMRAERAAVMDLFGRYVSRPVARELWQRRAEFMDGRRPRPQRMVITAMLTDLRGYTGAAEKMDPGALMDWVNEYMDAMTQVIEDHGGFVDDYTGDGIKANFGVPIHRGTPDQVRRDARTATRCALQMGRTLERLDDDWRRRGLPTARMRIGLFTGEVVVGSIGSRARMKYTTVGDTVNTAARLEAFRKEEFEAEDAGGAGATFRVIIGGTTYAQLGDSFETVFLGEHALRGRGEPVAIHRVLGERRRPEKEEA